MKCDNNEPRRRSTRLKGCDYKEGVYFITVCVHNKRFLFGVVAEAEMRLNESGRLVWAAWNDLPRHYPYVILDAFVVMPNHVHGIIILTDERACLPDAGADKDLALKMLNEPEPFDRTDSNPSPQFVPTIPQIPHKTYPHVGAGLKPALTKGARRQSLPEIIRGFKTFSARRINHLQGTLGEPVWQRSFYDHIIRKEESVARIREYIAGNPAQWEYDRENPAATARI